MTQSPDQRTAGILVPVFALRGKIDLGIGDTAALNECIDWAAELGFDLLKILPINETGGDHSPYNAISSRALDPMTIHTVPGAMQDLGEPEYTEAVKAVDTVRLNPKRVNYAVVKPLKRQLLAKAFARFERGPLRRDTKRGQEFRAFVKAEREWLDDYALFRTLMEFNGASERWDHWEQEHRTPEAARRWLARLPKRKFHAIVKHMHFFCYVCSGSHLGNGGRSRPTLAAGEWPSWAIFHSTIGT